MRNKARGEQTEHGCGTRRDEAGGEKILTVDRGFQGESKGGEDRFFTEEIRAGRVRGDKNREKGGV